MWNKSLIAVFVLALFPVEVFADDPIYYCEKCRRPANYYHDFGNFAFNAVFGADPWIGLQRGQATYTQPLLVVNRYGQIVGVYFRGLASLGTTLTIRVERPNGVLEEYKVLKSRIGTDLQVGGPGMVGGGPAGGGGSGGGGSGGGAGGGYPDPGGVVCGTTQVDNGRRRRTCIRV